MDNVTVVRVGRVCAELNSDGLAVLEMFAVTEPVVYRVVAGEVGELPRLDDKLDCKVAAIARVVVVEAIGDSDGFVELDALGDSDKPVELDEPLSLENVIVL